MPFWAAPYAAFRPLRQRAQFLNLGVVARRCIRQWQACRIEHPRLAAEMFEQPCSLLREGAAALHLDELEANAADSRSDAMVFGAYISYMLRERILSLHVKSSRIGAKINLQIML